MLCDHFSLFYRIKLIKSLNCKGIVCLLLFFFIELAILKFTARERYSMLKLSQHMYNHQLSPELQQSLYKDYKFRIQTWLTFCRTKGGKLVFPVLVFCRRSTIFRYDPSCCFCTYLHLITWYIFQGWLCRVTDTGKTTYFVDAS